MLRAGEGETDMSRNSSDSFTAYTVVSHNIPHFGNWWCRLAVTAAISTTHHWQLLTAISSTLYIGLKNWRHRLQCTNEYFAAPPCFMDFNDCLSDVHGGWVQNCHRMFISKIHVLPFYFMYANTQQGREFPALIPWTLRHKRVELFVVVESCWVSVQYSSVTSLCITL